MIKKLHLFAIVSTTLLVAIIGFRVLGGEQKVSELKNQTAQLQVQERKKNNEDVDRLRGIRRATCDWWPKRTEEPCCFFCCLERPVRQDPWVQRRMEPP